MCTGHLGQNTRRRTRPCRRPYPLAVDKMSKAELHELVADATVDCHDEEEQASGLYNMLEEYLAVPFRTRVLGVDVTVENVELKDDSRIVAVCVRGETRQAISLADLPLPDPAPEGSEWIDAYRVWADWAH
jgi:hypothetical protein